MAIVVAVGSTVAAATRHYKSYCYSARHFCGRSSSPRNNIVVSNCVRNHKLYLASSTSTTVGSAMLFASPLAMGNVIETTSLGISLHKTTSRFISSTTAGRSRKRPRPWRRRHQNQSGDASTGGVGEIPLSSLSHDKNNTDENNTDENNTDENENDSPLGYPKGKPWRILWPRPHGEPKSSDPTLSDYRNRIPTVEQVRRGWSMYKETWEDGITGIPTKQKERTTKTGEGGAVSLVDSQHILTEQQLHDIGDNASSNLKIVRKDAQDLLEHTKETTGIRTQDDLKALASEAMKIATECIREFMTGYRKGRDNEIDNMLHKYFQEEEEETNNSGEKELLQENSKGDNPENDGSKNSNNGDKTTSAIIATPGRKRRRKPKRGIPRI